VALLRPLLRGLLRALCSRPLVEVFEACLPLGAPGARTSHDGARAAGRLTPAAAPGTGRAARGDAGEAAAPAVLSRARWLARRLLGRLRRAGLRGAHHSLTLYARPRVPRRRRAWHGRHRLLRGKRRPRTGSGPCALRRVARRPAWGPAQGFVVLALEHADGTAAAARLAGGAGWRFYSGWGSEAERMRQTQCGPFAVRGHEHFENACQQRIVKPVTLTSGAKAH